MLVGDFNIHVEDENDKDHLAFHYPLESFWLIQHVEYLAHRIRAHFGFYYN